MRLKNLFKDLEYVGEAAGDRLSYAVFRGPNRGPQRTPGFCGCRGGIPILDSWGGSGAHLKSTRLS